MDSAKKRMVIGLCVILILIIPILVRLPSATFPSMTDEERLPYQDEQGRYYLTDPDSYYYVRDVSHHLETGGFGDSTFEDGTPRDSLRFYPEGSKVNNSPGIVYLTEAIWKPLNAVFGISLYEVEYCLTAVMAALAGMVTFLLTRRISGNLGGLISGILVSCAPIFVQRTTFGRFDTDMFVVLMDILLMLFVSEALRAKTPGKRIIYSVCFVLTAWIYSMCWTAEVVIVITGFTLFGGFVYLLWNLIGRRREKKAQTRFQHVFSDLWVIAGCAVAAILMLIIQHGTGIIESILSFIPLTADTVTATGTMPNVLMVVSELDAPNWIPERFGQWLWDPTPTRGISVMTGVGGAMVMLATLAGIMWLTVQSMRRFHWEEKNGLSVSESRIYLCILLIALASWIFLVRYGIRFVEHLAVPMGILAGVAIGQIGAYIQEKNGKNKWIRTGLCAVLCAATVISAVADAIGIISTIRPSVSRVSDEAMEWIRENAEDPEAVITSWWDYGYYYEEASGHPCLWDGGSMDPVRAILFSKAMTTHNLELSRRILLMLSSNGNRAVDYLMEHVDAEMAFDTVWEGLLLGKAETEELLMSRCGMSKEKATTAEALLHPKKSKETYLIITDTMIRQIAWFEYYAYWHFNGNNPIPRATTQRYTPEGYPIESPEGQRYMDLVRGEETLWRLYMEEEEDERFRLVFNRTDNVEGLWMWRVV